MQPKFDISKNYTTGCDDIGQGVRQLNSEFLSSVKFCLRLLFNPSKEFLYYVIIINIYAFIWLHLTLYLQRTLCLLENSKHLIDVEVFAFFNLSNNFVNTFVNTFIFMFFLFQGNLKCQNNLLTNMGQGIYMLLCCPS